MKKTLTIVFALLTLGIASCQKDTETAPESAKKINENMSELSTDIRNAHGTWD